MTGGIFSGIGSGMLGLEMPLSQSHPQQNHENPQHVHGQSQHSQMGVPFPHQQDMDPKSQSVKHHYPYSSKARQQQQQQQPRQQSPLSDEDEAGVAPEDSNGDGKRTISPWQRMKWTDNMVKLLIAAVYYIGDEVGSDLSDPSWKKKPGGLLQKKGKWKSVSRAMMQKGFYVSPQQCEDKFNDLNKRYKRVNDILGKGTACRVVENQSLLESMDHVSPKMKEEVRKLLSSKHLFFREMCAYHNSGGGGSAASGGGPIANHQQSPEMASAEQQQQPCLHSSDRATLDAAVKVGSEEDEDEDDEDDEDDDEEDDGMENDEAEDRQHPMKRRRRESPSLVHEFRCELLSVAQDGMRSPVEKRQWMRVQMIQLEGKRVECLREAFELEKQRLKWLKYSGKKEREFDLWKLKNERNKLENERMMLLVKQKEMELNYIHHHHQQSTNKVVVEPHSSAT